MSTAVVTCFHVKVRYRDLGSLPVKGPQPSPEATAALASVGLCGSGSEGSTTIVMRAGSVHGDLAAITLGMQYADEFARAMGIEAAGELVSAIAVDEPRWQRPEPAEPARTTVMGYRIVRPDGNIIATWQMPSHLGFSGWAVRADGSLRIGEDVVLGPWRAERQAGPGEPWELITDSESAALRTA